MIFNIRQEITRSQDVELESIPFGLSAEDLDDYYVEYVGEIGECVCAELHTETMQDALANYKIDTVLELGEWKTLYADELCMVRGKNQEHQPLYQLVIPLQSAWEDCWEDETVEAELDYY